jgi:hypothetical protein
LRKIDHVNLFFVFSGNIFSTSPATGFLASKVSAMNRREKKIILDAFLAGFFPKLLTVGVRWGVRDSYYWISFLTLFLKLAGRAV